MLKKYLVIIFILILLFLLIFFLKFNNNKNKINYIKLNNSNILRPIIKEYIKYIPKYQFKLKTKSKVLKKDKLEDIYINNILEFKKDERILLNKCINIINSICKNYKCIVETDWNFVKVSDNIEKGMPFTLDKYIFLPKNFLKKAKFMNKIDIIETLIHEKIHIIQRNNKSIFEKFYKEKLHSNKVDNIQLNNYWINKNFVNPDGLNIGWIYKHKGNYYLPLLIGNINGVEEIITKLKYIDGKFIVYNFSKDISKFELFKNLPKNISLYHPNEISAYMISKILVKKETNKIFNEFMDNDLKKICV